MTAITRAIVPVAGLGTRMMPMSAVLPKALLPLTDGRNRCRAVIHWIAAAARDAGVEELALVILSAQQEPLANYFAAACSGSTFDHADPPLPRIFYVVQDRPAGFGDAVLRAEPLMGNQPFLLLLGDHVYASPADAPSCVAQIVQAFGKHPAAAMIGMQAVEESELPNVGAARGEPLAKDATSPRLFRCTDFIEKPTTDQARQKLVTPGLPDGQYLAHAGIYVFTPEIFDCLSIVRPDANNELQLANAQSLLLERHPKDYLLCEIAGRAFDTGNPAGYTAAVKQWV